MNHIHNLTASNDMKTAQLDAVTEWMIRVGDHLNGPKFKEDSTIQVSDVLAFMANLRSELIDIEMQPWGWAHPIGKASKDWEAGNRNKHNHHCNG